MLIKGGSQVNGRSGHSLGHVLKLEENLKTEVGCNYLYMLGLKLPCISKYPQVNGHIGHSLGNCTRNWTYLMSWTQMDQSKMLQISDPAYLPWM